MAADQKLYVQVLRQIHQLILDRGLKPGDLLPPEQVLAAEFGVSRNVVREAIKSMEVMGIVRAVAGRGTELLPFSMEYILQSMLFFQVPGNESAVRQMFDVRKNLEMSYMRQAFHAMTREDIARLRELADNGEAILGKENGDGDQNRT
jgi:DNA-binding FadR family transcriptional regulator